MIIVFRKNYLMKYFLLAFATASVLFPAMVMAATVGFYAGTFDPPTRAEMGMLRCALGDTNVRKQCARNRQTTCALGGIGK